MTSWKKLDSELIVSLKLQPQSPLLVQYPEEEKKEKNNIINFLYAEEGSNKTYYIPGGSLKGVLRSHTEKIFFQFRLIDTYFSQETEENNTTEKPDDHVKLLFGDSGFRGRLTVDDAYFPIGTTPSQSHHTAIDRFRAAAKSGALYTVESITSGKAQTTIRLKNPKPWEVMWLCFLLRDLEIGRVTIGAKTSIGYGKVKLSEVSWIFNIYNQELLAKWNDILRFGTPKNNYAYQSYVFYDNQAFIDVWEDEWTDFVHKEGMVKTSNE